MSIYFTGFWINDNTTSFREVLLGGTTLATIVSSPLRVGSKALRCTAAGANTSFAKILAPGSQGQTNGAPNTNAPNSYERFYFSWATKPAANSEQIFVIADIAGNEKMRVFLTAGGNIQVRDSTTAPGAIIGTSVTSLAQNAAYRLELLTGSGVSANWAVNIYAGDSTTPLESMSGTANLAVGGNYQVILGKESNTFNQSVDYYFGDFLWTDVGFPGPGQCALLLPMADGTFANGVSNGAAQLWQCVDEIPPDGDVSFINGLTSGQSYTARMGPTIQGTINSVKIYMAGKREAGNTSFIASLLSGGILAGTDGNVLGFANYSPLQKTFDVDPATGLPWTTAAVNAMQAGFTLNNANPGRVTAVYAMVDYVPFIPFGQKGWTESKRQNLWGRQTGAEEMATEELKHTGESYAFFFEFKQHPILIAGDTLSGTPTLAQFIGPQTTTDLTIGVGNIVGTQALFNISGGVDRTTYRLKCTATTAGGATLQGIGRLLVSDDF